MTRSNVTPAADMTPAHNAAAASTGRDALAGGQDMCLALTFDDLLGDDDATDETADDIIRAVRAWRGSHPAGVLHAAMMPWPDMARVGASRGAVASRPHTGAMRHHPRSTTMAERYTLDGVVITKMELPGAPHAGADHGRLFINEAQMGVMAWWSMGRWANVAARETVITKATTMTLADFRVWFDRHEDPFGANEDAW